MLELCRQNWGLLSLFAFREIRVCAGPLCKEWLIFLENLILSKQNNGGAEGMEYKAFLYFSRNKYDKIVYDLKGTQALNNKYGMREFW